MNQKIISNTKTQTFCLALCTALVTLSATGARADLHLFKPFDSLQERIQMSSPSLYVGGGFADDTDLKPMSEIRPEHADCIINQVENIKKALPSLTGSKNLPMSHVNLIIDVDPRAYNANAQPTPVVAGDNDYAREYPYGTIVYVQNDDVAGTSRNLTVSMGINKWGDCKLISVDDIVHAKPSNQTGF